MKEAEVYPRLIHYDEACAYLRIDFTTNRNLVDGYLEEAARICFEEAKITPKYWTEIRHTQTVVELMRVGILYTIGYLYERGHGDQHDLRLVLRNILHSIRLRDGR